MKNYSDELRLAKCVCRYSFLSNLRKRGVDLYSTWFWEFIKLNKNFPFLFLFLKTPSCVSFVVSLTIQGKMAPCKTAHSVRVWFIGPWRINGISFLIWRNFSFASMLYIILPAQYILTEPITWPSFTSVFINCSRPFSKDWYINPRSAIMLSFLPSIHLVNHCVEPFPYQKYFLTINY